MLQTETLQIPVPLSFAKDYKNVSKEEQKKMQMLLHVSLMQAKHDPRSLDEISKEATATAKEKGLTEEILQEILNEK